MVTAVADLDERIAGRAGLGSAGDTFTLADIILGGRRCGGCKWLGMGFAWQGGHRAERRSNTATGWRPMLERLLARPSFKRPCRDHRLAGRAAQRIRGRTLPGRDTPKPAPATPRTSDAAVEGHGRDIREESLTGAVLATMKGTQNPRARAGAERVHPASARLPGRGAADRGRMGMGHRVPDQDRPPVEPAGGRNSSFCPTSWAPPPGST
jgi:hypothetical protein